MNKLLGLGHFEHIVRKSRFVAVCGPIADAAAATDFIAAHGADDCKHVCWAFRAGKNCRFDDAGEPSGTAGRPILATIDQFELDDTMAVVNRYFGGTKLGTGGLARAFSSSVIGAIENAIEQSGWQPIVAMSRCEIRAGFDFEATLYHLIEQHQGMRINTNYQADGLRVRIELPTDQIEAFSMALAEQSRGQARIDSLTNI
ncbi:MAG: YigZ family protein [Pseudomonadota bacterium]